MAQGEAALFEETAADNKVLKTDIDPILFIPDSKQRFYLQDASAGLSATLNTQKKFLKMTFQDCNDLATAVANLEAACEKARAVRALF